MKKVTYALKLAEMGFHVFPLIKNSKLPLIKDFPNKATTDPATIKEMWSDDFNIGISTTRFNGSQSLLVVDVDNKGNKKGDERLLELELDGKDFPPTMTQSTPTGGSHLIYSLEEPVKQGINVLGDGLDIRSNGGYIVAAGSDIDGKRYKLNRTPMHASPEWLKVHCGKPNDPEERIDVAMGSVNQEAATKRAAEYLKTAEPAVEGDGGDEHTYRICAKVLDFGLEPSATYEVIMDYWNDRCQPPWSAEEMLAKVNHAVKYRQKGLGSSSPEADFTPLDEAATSGVGGSYLDKINQDYALVFGSEKHMVLHETIDEKGRPARVFMGESTFKRKFSTHTVQVDNKISTEAHQWLNWGGRREYAGLCFKPEQKANNNFYNLWAGFTYKPVPYSMADSRAQRGLDMLLDLGENVICDGDNDLFKWLMSYVAHMIQKPYEKPLTTLVFKGEKGVGKNVFIDCIGKLLGSRHYLVAHDSRYLSSNFNGHMDSCLCLVLDEAFWSGDKSAEGKLKGLTTSPEILIERKGKEPYTVDNLVRVVIIGNEEWLVPAGIGERRYAVFAVNNKYRQNIPHFSLLIKGMNGGGYNVLLDYLKNYKITHDVNKAPNTQALVDQKLSSLTALQDYWQDCLTAGEIVGSGPQGWPEAVDKETFRDAFIYYCDKNRMKERRPGANQIGKLLKQICPAIVTNQKDQFDGDWKNSYRLPPLEDCREAWNIVIDKPK